MGLDDGPRNEHASKEFLQRGEFRHAMQQITCEGRGESRCSVETLQPMEFSGSTHFPLRHRTKLPSVVSNLLL